MIPRRVLLAALVAVSVARGGGSSRAERAAPLDEVDEDRQAWCAQECGDLGNRCPPQCPAFPAVPPCPKPTCPTPICPQPVCPPLPPIPACPLTECPPLVCSPPPPCPKPCIPAASLRKSLPTGPRGPGNYEYEYYGNNATWFEANETCVEHGGYLVVPKSKADVDKLINIMKNKRIGHLHIGFHDNEEEGHYISVLGEPMTETQRAIWKYNEPSGGRIENCAVLHVKDNMHDWPCSSKFPFICEEPQ